MLECCNSSDVSSKQLTHGFDRWPRQVRKFSSIAEVVFLLQYAKLNLIACVFRKSTAVVVSSGSVADPKCHLMAENGVKQKGTHQLDVATSLFQEVTKQVHMVSHSEFCTANKYVVITYTFGYILCDSACSPVQSNDLVRFCSIETKDGCYLKPGYFF